MCVCTYTSIYRYTLPIRLYVLFFGCEGTLPCDCWPNQLNLNKPVRLLRSWCSRPNNPSCSLSPASGFYHTNVFIYSFKQVNSPTKPSTKDLN